ncbi:unnamed protein product [Allacma fusca]|uniref:Gamma-tubulin complex component n=1 Tax=Allacma fusca TaxID=39272 RepID=A0A8J2K5N1_9HEXA|nr:unnamed protein product [Allacma fusca]
MDLNTIWLETRKIFRFPIPGGPAELRNIMCFFIDHLQHYLQEDVLENQYSILLNSIEKSETFEQIRVAHANFQTSILAQAFQTNQKVLHFVEELLSLGTKFTDFMISHIQTCERSNLPINEGISREIEDFSKTFKVLGLRDYLFRLSYDELQSNFSIKRLREKSVCKMLRIRLLSFTLFTIFVLEATARHRNAKYRGSSSQGEHENETQCRGQRTHSLKFKSSIENCRDSVSDLEANSPKEKMNILMTYRLCIWEEQGIYKNGLIHTHALGQHLKVLFPGRVGKDLSAAVMSNCFNPEEENETLIVDPDELEVITPFLRCIQKTWTTVCDEERK